MALHGFDPVFRNGMEDIDLCLRLFKKPCGPGGSSYSPESRVTTHESQTPGRYDSYDTWQPRAFYLQRWGSTAARETTPPTLERRAGSASSTTRYSSFRGTATSRPSSASRAGA